ncbi:MAG TPA: hypothetical protein EYP22_05845 [Methanosarcinales archaeon]|nr:hypothetical protein [Methanosarcinales archaeon]
MQVLQILSLFIVWNIANSGIFPAFTSIAKVFPCNTVDGDSIEIVANAEDVPIIIIIKGIIFCTL